MENSIYLVAVAAGRGVRMGSDIPKQFMELAGRPILQRTLEKFVEACPGIRIVTVLPEDYIPIWKEFCYSRNFDCQQTLVKGGMTRFHSVKNALEKIPDGAIVAVHDGVRPLLSVEMIRRMLGMMERCRAVVPVTPSYDTLKVLEKDRDTGELVQVEGATADRSIIYGVQTPQIFHIEDLRRGYSLPFDMDFTDDSSVLSAAGVPITWCEGERLNLKVTSPEDLVLAEAIIKATSGK